MSNAFPVNFPATHPHYEASGTCATFFTPAREVTGYGRLDRRTKEWSLCTANGLDVIFTTKDLQKAAEYLADLHAETIARLG